jgi:carboxymethylenebutenolidase
LRIAGTKAPKPPSCAVLVSATTESSRRGAKATLRTAFDSAKLSAEVEVYPAAHGWCPPDTQVYDAAQAERAWARLLATLSKALV